MYRYDREHRGNPMYGLIFYFSFPLTDVTISAERKRTQPGVIECVVLRVYSLHVTIIDLNVSPNVSRHVLKTYYRQ